MCDVIRLPVDAARPTLIILLICHTQLFQEFQAGIWTAEEYREQIKSLSGSPPAKCQHCEYSPDWDEDLLQESFDIE